MTGTIKVRGRNMNGQMVNNLGCEIYYLNSNYVLVERDLRSNLDLKIRFTDVEIIEVFNCQGIWSLLDRVSSNKSLKRTQAALKGPNYACKRLGCTVRYQC